MTKGAYKVTITKNADGSYFALLTYDGQCVPGIHGRHFDTKAKAEAAGRRMLGKV